MTDDELMKAIDEQVAHIWMVRTFLKHSDEVTDDEELAEVHRELYDFAHALGGPLESSDTAQYLHLARKKLSKLKRATELFVATACPLDHFNQPLPKSLS
jgi:heterodisulfide reductase subunit B